MIGVELLFVLQILLILAMVWCSFSYRERIGRRVLSPQRATVVRALAGLSSLSLVLGGVGFATQGLDSGWDFLTIAAFLSGATVLTVLFSVQDGPWPIGALGTGLLGLAWLFSGLGAVLKNEWVAFGTPSTLLAGVILASLAIALLGSTGPTGYANEDQVCDTDPLPVFESENEWSMSRVSDVDGGDEW